MRRDAVVGVDWSGAKAADGAAGTWAATVRNGRVDDLRNGPRCKIVDYVASLPGHVLAGFDFSFSYPAWFVRALGCADVRDLWARVAADGEGWLADVPEPFYGKGGKKQSPVVAAWKRCCEAQVGAESSFCLAGAKQVGTGAIRGMPFLIDLQRAGWSIWPFDPVSDRVVVEVYPALAQIPDVDALPPAVLPEPWRARARASRDAMDAVRAALALWQHRRELSTIDRSCLDLLEGAIFPTAPVRIERR